MVSIELIHRYLQSHPLIERNKESRRLRLMVVLLRVKMHSCHVLRLEVEHEYLVKQDQVARLACFIGSTLCARIPIHIDSHRCCVSIVFLANSRIRLDFVFLDLLLV